MYHYSILKPIKFNWKYVAPKTFTELEYFITPNLSLGLDLLSNGKNDFSIGAYLVGSMSKTTFMNEHLVKRSAERVKTAFDKESVSVFFTPEEAKELDTLFEEERFIARKVVIYKNDRVTDLFALNEEEFAKVMEAFTELGVQQSIDFQSERESFENLRNDMYDQAYKTAQANFKSTQKKKENVRKKDLYKQGGIGAGLILAGALLRFAGTRLAATGILGMLGGGICQLVSLVTGVVGLKYVEGATDYFTEGVVFE